MRIRLIQSPFSGFDALNGPTATLYEQTGVGTDVRSISTAPVALTKDETKCSELRVSW